MVLRNRTPNDVLLPNATVKWFMTSHYFEFFLTVKGFKYVFPAPGALSTSGYISADLPIQRLHLTNSDSHMLDSRQPKLSSSHLI